MRENKFRGTSKHSGKAVYGDLVHKRDKTFIFQYDDSDATPSEPGFIEIEVIKNTVEQYTGLKDAHGKDIYEGDFVKMDRHYFGGMMSEDFIGKVEFYEASFVVDNGKDFSCGVFTEEGEWEIVGNVHEKKEELYRGGNTYDDLVGIHNMIEKAKKEGD